jgi:hypothetical protein
VATPLRSGGIAVLTSLAILAVIVATNIPICG